MNLHNIPWLISSLKTSGSRIPRPNLFQPRSPCICMPSRKNLHSISTSTISLWSASSTIWLKPLIPTSCMPHIKLPSIHLIQGHHMERQSFTWFTIWRRLMSWAYFSSLIPTKVLNATAMLNSQDCGTRHLRQLTLVPPSHDLVGSSSMQVTLSLGPPNFNPKLHSTPPKLSTLQWHKLWGTSFLSWDYCRKWGSKISRFFAPSLMCLARLLKTTLAPLNWQGSPSFALGLST